MDKKKKKEKNKGGKKKSVKASDTNNLTLSNLKFNDFKETFLLGLFTLKMKQILVKMYFYQISSRVFVSNCSWVAIYSYHMLKLKRIMKSSSLKECKIQ